MVDGLPGVKVVGVWKTVSQWKERFGELESRMGKNLVVELQQVVVVQMKKKIKTTNH